MKCFLLKRRKRKMSNSEGIINRWSQRKWEGLNAEHIVQTAMENPSPWDGLLFPGFPNWLPSPFFLPLYSPIYPSWPRGSQHSFFLPTQPSPWCCLSHQMPVISAVLIAYTHVLWMFQRSHLPIGPSIKVVFPFFYCDSLNTKPWQNKWAFTAKMSPYRSQDKEKGSSPVLIRTSTFEWMFRDRCLTN